MECLPPKDVLLVNSSADGNVTNLFFFLNNLRAITQTCHHGPILLGEVSRKRKVLGT